MFCDKIAFILILTVIFVHPDIGLEEGVEGDHLGVHLEGPEFLVEKREGGEHFGQVF